MRKISALFGVVILFALTWAAGHDILKGEQDVWAEYTVVAASLVLAGFRLTMELKKFVIRLRNQ